MDPMKFLYQDVKPTNLLGYSLGCFYLAINTPDAIVEILLLVVALISFVLSAAIFIKTNFSLPLVPCKNRLEKNNGFICYRDIGFYLGFFISILAIILIKKYQIDPPLKDHSLLIGIIFTISTMVHGTLKRCFRVLTSDNFFNNLLTFIVGFITGIGVLFVAIYLIFIY